MIKQTSLNGQKRLKQEKSLKINNNQKKNDLDVKNHGHTKKYIPFTKKWRVKLYILNEKGIWEDKGVGQVYCANEKNREEEEEKKRKNNENNDNNGKNNENEKIKKLIFKKEKTNEIVFNLDILKENVEFHNQSEIILTWKNNDLINEDNIAFSFQEKEGLFEILKTINLVRGKNFSKDDLLKNDNINNKYYVSIDNLPNLVKEFENNMDDNKLENFKEYLKDTNYEFIKKIGKILFEEEKKIEESNSSISSISSFSCSSIDTDISFDLIKDIKNEKEKDFNDKIKDNKNSDLKIVNKVLEEEDNINYIYNIFKNLILIGDKELLELLFNDEHYLISFAAIEHESQSINKVPHRKYFKEIVKFKNPLNIQDSNLLQKINQNLRLSYLRDTAFGRIINDITYKTISLIILNNQRDIVQFFINNSDYFDILFSQMKSEDINIQSDAILFLSELISYSKRVSESGVTFHEILCKNDLLPILSYIIENNKNNKNIIDNNIKELININVIEIFISILSIIPKIIDKYLIENEKILETFADIIIEHDNFSVKYEISQIFKSLIESDKKIYDKKVFFNPIIEKFINYLISKKEGNKSEISSTVQIIIEIFMSWFNKMGFDSELWLDEYQINLVILNLLKEKNKIVNLYSIKLLKLILEKNENCVSNKILSKDLCNALIDLFKQNFKNNNIIISCLMNFFDTISQNNIYILNIIMNYSSDFFYDNEKQFKNIILRYEEKSTPKKKLIAFLKDNSYTESSILEIEPVFLNNISNKANEDDNNCYFDNLNILKDFFKEEDNNKDDIINTFEEENNYLNKKRNIDINDISFPDITKPKKKKNNCNMIYYKNEKHYKEMYLNEDNENDLFGDFGNNENEIEDEYE